jgi:hypothetical protein
MPEQSLLSAYQKMVKELENQDLTSLQPLYQAVEKVEEAMQPFHRRDESYGMLPLLDEEKKADLMQLHLELGRTAEKLIASELPEAQKDAVRNLSALAAGNYRQLRSCNLSRGSKTLPEVLDAARTYVVDTRKANLNKHIGCAQNARQPLTFLMDNGMEVTGVFTARKDIAVWDNWTARFESTALQSTGFNSEKIKNVMGNFMRRLDTPQAAKILDLPENADHAARIGAVYRTVMLDRGTENSQIADLFAQVSNIKLENVPPVQEKALTIGEMSAILDRGPLTSIKTAIYSAANSIMNNTMVARVHDGARMDNRNAAMSAVASLLGVPGLLAKSVPMTVLDQKGQPIEGTFMMEAFGVDPSNIRPKESGLGGASSMKGAGGRAIQSIADLQVLDYICGNVDRHGNNVTYKFDEKGKFAGVQGFDNDCAFGRLIPGDNDTMTSHLVHIDQMGVISSSMYKRLTQTTPDMLRFTLRGYDLSEEELDAACVRMKQVRDAAERDLGYFGKEEQERTAGTGKEKKRKPLVEQNRLRVLPDEEFAGLDIEDLCLNRKKAWYDQRKRGPKEIDNGNMFSKVFETVKQLGSFFLQKKEYRSLRSSVALGSDNRGNPGAPLWEAERGHDLEDRMRECTWFGRSSPEFQAMQTVVAKYAAFQDTLNERIRGAVSSLRGQDMNKLDSCHRDVLFNSVVTFSDLSEMNELSREMKQAAEAYLSRKDPNKKYSAYTQSRIDLAKEVLAFSRGVSDQELETSARNERQMNQYLLQSAGRELEIQDRKAAREKDQLGEPRREGPPAEEQRKKENPQKKRKKGPTTGPKP